jgi:hypothetical protein
MNNSDRIGRFGNGAQCMTSCLRGVEKYAGLQCQGPMRPPRGSDADKSSCNFYKSTAQCAPFRRSDKDHVQLRRVGTPDLSLGANADAIYLNVRVVILSRILPTEPEPGAAIRARCPVYFFLGLWLQPLPCSADRVVSPHHLHTWVSGQAHGESRQGLLTCHLKQ